MKEFLPSKKLFVFFIVPLLMTTSLFLMFKDDPKINTGEVSKISNTNNSADNNEFIDIEEIKKASSGDNLTETDKLARNFFSGFLKLKQTDQLNTEKQTALMQAIIDDSINETRNNKYAIQDIKITQDESLKNIIKYKKNIELILKKLFDIKEDETLILAKAIQNKDDSQYEKLNLAQKTYEDIIKKLIATEVPESVSVIHLEMINDLDRLAENIQGLASFKDDPMSTLKSLGELKNTEKQLTATFQKLTSYFIEKIVKTND